MKKGLIFIATFIVFALSAGFSQEPGKVDFKFTPDTLVEDRLNVPIDISVRFERICLTSRKKFANYPDGVKHSIADDLGTIFNNRLITEGDVSILIDVKTLMFDFNRRFFALFSRSVEFIGVAELTVTLYESESMNKITSYQINHSISKRDRQSKCEKYFDFYDSNDNVVLQVLKEALNEAKTKIIKDREKIEAYWKTPLTDISPELFFRYPVPVEVKDTFILQFEKQQYEYSYIVDNSYIIDDRDGTVYGVTKIGDQFWMDQNLKWLPIVYPPDQESHTNAVFYVYGYDGKDISEAKATEQYKNYGVLYNWSAAKIACPKGWRLPDDSDWQVLQDHLIQHFPEVSSESLGNMLKSTRQISSKLGAEYAIEEHPRWNRNRRNFGEDLFDFSALPGGYRNFHRNNFVGLGEIGAWWSFTEVSLNKASSKSIFYNTGQLRKSLVGRFQYENTVNDIHFAAYKPAGLSVRCVLGRNPLRYQYNLQAFAEDYYEINMLYDLVNEPVIVQPEEPEKFDYFMFGAGYGLSYGGVGLQFQRFYQERRKIGIHAGLGYLPAKDHYDTRGSIFYTVGTKFFLSELDAYNFYLNFQIGTLAKHRTQYHEIEFLIGISEIFNWYHHNDDWYDNEKDFNLYGPSVLFGYEVFSQSGLGFNFALGGGITILGNHKNALPLYQLVPVFDLGVVYRKPID